MARFVHSNDPARRLRLTYRGSPNLPLPGGGARLPMIGAGFVMMPVALLAAWVLSVPITWVIAFPASLLAHAGFTAAVGVGGTIFTLRKIGKKVDPITPLRYWWQAIRNDLNAPRPDETLRVDVIDLDAVRFAEDKPEHVTVHVTELPSLHDPRPPSRRFKRRRTH